MKAVKISFALLFVSVVMAVSTTLWKKENSQEKMKLSTGKVKEEISVKQEFSTEPVEKEIEQEKNSEIEKTEVNVPTPEVNELTNGNEKTSNNTNVQQENKESQVANNNKTQQSNNNSINSKIPEQTTEPVQEVVKEENKNSNYISSDNQAPVVYTKENDVIADSRLIRDAATYEECEEYGREKIKTKPECESGCAISCRAIMGKYTGETIGFMLTIRLMDGYGTVVPFSRD